MKSLMKAADSDRRTPGYHYVPCVISICRFGQPIGSQVAMLPFQALSIRVLFG
jgi:hypothetical protein